jgi:hypothetical protein
MPISTNPNEIASDEISRLKNEIYKREENQSLRNSFEFTRRIGVLTTSI